MVLAVEEIETLAATGLDMVMVIVLEVAGEPVAQEEEEVMITNTWSPLFKEELE